MPSIVLSMLRSRCPRDTAFTVDMSSQTFLHAVEGTPLVAAHEKPKWSEILKPTEDKLVELILCCSAYFDTKKTEYISNSRNRGSMSGKAATFRITDVKLTYILACIKVAVWPTVLQNHTAKRAHDLEAMFRRGALDVNLKQIASKMDERFQPTDIAWVKSAEPSADVFGNKVQAAEQECICMGTVWHDFNTHA